MIDQNVLLQRILVQADTRERLIVGLAGPPASGKSTLAAWLATTINQQQADVAVVLPMDGYHLDNEILQARSCLDRKGAPFTFDVAGFAAMLDRVRSLEDDIHVPVFDRELDLAKAGARTISRQHTIILVEGNYLLLDQAPYSQLSDFFDLTVFLPVDEATLTQRLIDRWITHGLSPDAAIARAELNDLPNARLVMSCKQPADIELSAS